MHFREATVEDIAAMQIVRHAVKENVLSNPALVTDNDCKDYITHRGKGWICEVNKQVVAFGIADLQGNSIWALFVEPAQEHQGIGRKLHDTMLMWYFSQTAQTLWLTTAPSTRAEAFYTKAGWKAAGAKANGEIKFEMTFADWQCSRVLSTETGLSEY